VAITSPAGVRGIEALVTPVSCIGSGEYEAGLEWEGPKYLVRLHLRLECPDTQASSIQWEVFQQFPLTKLGEGTFGVKPILGQPYSLRIARTGNTFAFVLATAVGASQRTSRSRRMGAMEQVPE